MTLDLLGSDSVKLLELLFTGTPTETPVMTLPRTGGCWTLQEAGNVELLELLPVQEKRRWSYPFAFGASNLTNSG